MRGVVLLLVVLSIVAYAQSAMPNFTRWVDVSVYNFTALVDVAEPDFVMDVDGCSVYVYVVRDFETAKMPLLHTNVPKTSMPASPMDSEEILDAFIKVDSRGGSRSINPTAVFPKNARWRWIFTSPQS